MLIWDTFQGIYKCYFQYRVLSDCSMASIHVTVVSSGSGYKEIHWARNTHADYNGTKEEVNYAVTWWKSECCYGDSNIQYCVDQSWCPLSYAIRKRLGFNGVVVSYNQYRVRVWWLCCCVTPGSRVWEAESTIVDSHWLISHSVKNIKIWRQSINTKTVAARSE